MSKNILQLLITRLLLQIQIYQIQLAILLFKKKLTVPNLPKPKYVIPHHGGGSWSFHQVNNHHKNKWGFKSSLGFYIGYHKWIAYDGRLYIARRDNERGAHAVERGRPHWWNKNSVGICLQGNFEKERPTDAQLKTLKKELDSYDVPIKQHKEIYPTLCPGKYLSEWLFKNY